MWQKPSALLGPSMIKYAKIVVLKKFNFKNNIFSTLTNVLKDINNLFKLHFEIIKHFIEFIVSCTWIFGKFLYKKNGWKVCSKLVGYSNFPKYFYIATLIDYD